MNSRVRQRWIDFEGFSREQRDVMGISRYLPLLALCSGLLVFTLQTPSNAEPLTKAAQHPHVASIIGRKNVPTDTCCGGEASVVPPKRRRTISHLNGAIRFDNRVGAEFSLPVPEDWLKGSITFTLERAGRDLSAEKQTYIQFVKSDPVIMGRDAAKGDATFLLQGENPATETKILYGVTRKGDLLAYTHSKRVDIKAKKDSKKLKETGLNLGVEFYQALTRITTPRILLFSEEASLIAQSMRIPAPIPFAIEVNKENKTLRFTVIEEVAGEDPFTLTLEEAIENLSRRESTRKNFGVSVRLQPTTTKSNQARQDQMSAGQGSWVAETVERAAIQLVVPTPIARATPTTQPTASSTKTPSAQTTVIPTHTPTVNPTSTSTETPTYTPTYTSTYTSTATPTVVPPRPIVTGRQYRVRLDGTGDFATIQACLNAAVGGDVCLVGAGVFLGELTFPRSGLEGKLISLIAENTYQASLPEERRSIVVGSILTKGFAQVSGLDVRDGTIKVGESNVIVSDNYIHGTGDKSFFGAVHILRSPKTKPFYQNVVVRNNHIEQVIQGFQIACSSNCLIEGNRVERLYTSIACRPSGACPGDVDYVRMFGDGIVFRNNYLGNSKLSEIDDDAHVDGIQSFNNGGLGGQGRDTFSNSVIEGNYIEDCHQPIWWTSENAGMLSSNVTIRNNIFNNSWGTAARMSIGGKNADRIYVYNNIFRQGVRVTAQTYSEVINNIFTANFTNTNTDKFSWPQGASVFSHNVFAPGGFVAKSIVLYPDLKATNKFFVDPNLVFVDAAIKDFRPKVGSPTIDFGLDLSNKGFAHDMLSTPRPAGAGWDVGAFEAP